jgi:TM2 domain-containing membrane protein YozV
MRDPGVAAVLSAIIPGIGQFYDGRILAGTLWLIITPGLWIGTGGLLGWVCHVISAYTAYTRTQVIIAGGLGQLEITGRGACIS